MFLPVKYELSFRLLGFQHGFFQNFFASSLEYVGTPRSLQGCCPSVVGAFMPMFIWSWHSRGKFRKNVRVFKHQAYETGTEEPKRGILKASLVIFTFFALLQLIYPPVNTLDTKLSVRISSGYWICQFYLNPFELLRNEFKS